MAEGIWGEDTRSPDIDWHMSAALQDVPRGGDDLAEVTSLEQAVRTWLDLDPQHRADARLKPERALIIEGVSHAEFGAEGIESLAKLLPANPGPVL